MKHVKTGLLLMSLTYSQVNAQTVPMREAQSQQMQDHQKLTPDEITMEDDIVNYRYGVMGTLGWPLAPAFGLGLGMNYVMSNRVWLEAGLNFGSQNFTEEELLGHDAPYVDSDMSMTSQLAQVGGRFFMGETFNIRAGVTYRKIVFDLKLEAIDGSSSVDEKISSVSLAGHFTIGNTWSMDNGKYFIGCDWFGVAVPFVSNKGTSETTTTGIPDSTLNEIADDAEDAAEKIGKITTYSFLNLHVGMFF